jgi:hypothetical protein
VYAVQKRERIEMVPKKLRANWSLAVAAMED